MGTGSLRSVAAVALVVLVAWMAYRNGGMLLSGASLGLLGTAFLVFRRLAAARPRAGLLHDPAVSTLVFPPETRVQRARPPR